MVVLRWSDATGLPARKHINRDPDVARPYEFPEPYMSQALTLTPKNVTVTKEDIWIYDCGAAVQNIVLLATYCGL